MIYNKDQEITIRDGVDWFLNGSDQVFEFDGVAGTGKSVVLNAIVNQLHLKPYEIAPCAYTGAAALVMRMKGFKNAKSIHSTFFKIEKMKKEYTPSPFKSINTEFNTEEYEYKFVPLNVGELDHNIKLIVIDEGYMVPDFMSKEIEKHGVKVLVAGDSGQLPPIGGNPAYLCNPNIHHLNEIMRQAQGNPIIYLSERARLGLPINNGLYGNRVLVIDESELTKEMVLGVGNIICCTNKTRDLFNNTIRNMLGFDDNPLPGIGERIICRNNNWNIEHDNIALANGLQGYVTSPFDISKYSGATYTLNFLPDLLETPFKNIEINTEYILSPYDLRQQIKNNKFRKGELFEYAYAITCHVSQGSQYVGGIFYEEMLRHDIQKQLIYTGITRFSDYMIYVKRNRNKYY